MKFIIKMTSVVPHIDGNLEQYERKIEAENKEEALKQYHKELSDIIKNRSCQASIFDDKGTLLENNCQL